MKNIHVHEIKPIGVYTIFVNWNEIHFCDIKKNVVCLKSLLLLILYLNITFYKLKQKQNTVKDYRPMLEDDFSIVKRVYFLGSEYYFLFDVFFSVWETWFELICAIYVLSNVSSMSYHDIFCLCT